MTNSGTRGTTDLHNFVNLSKKRYKLQGQTQRNTVIVHTR